MLITMSEKDIQRFKVLTDVREFTRKPINKNICSVHLTYIFLY
ncbi:hypothetical protein [Vibrio lentus]|nr:hypothetical protein [Vibrio lentus]